MKMEYDSTLAEQAYVLAKRWDSARDTDLSRLDFKDTDIKDFTANQICKLPQFQSTAYSLTSYSGLLGQPSVLPSPSVCTYLSPWRALPCIHFIQCRDSLPLLSSGPT